MTMMTTSISMRVKPARAGAAACRMMNSERVEVDAVDRVEHGESHEAHELAEHQYHRRLDQRHHGAERAADVGVVGVGHPEAEGVELAALLAHRQHLRRE